MTYLQEVRAARERYEGAVEEAEEGAAADALRIAEAHGRPLRAVCREIAGADASAVESRARRATRDPKARERDIRQGQLRAVRALAKTDPELVAREAAKVDVDAVIDVAAEAAGQTRKKSPSNKAKVEQAFGPEEFNRLEDAIEALVERLPDLAPNREDKTYAVELAGKAEFVAAVLRSWASGSDVAKEAEAWLQTR